MSKFINEANAENERQRGYSLDIDCLRGFKRAVNNNQMILAMDYLVQILDIIDANLEIKPNVEVKNETPASKPAAAKAKTAANKETNATD